LEGERRPGGAEIKDEVGREQTDEGGRAHWVRQAVAGRADAQIDALHGPKVALDVGERLVGFDQRARRQRIIRFGGADHVDVVEPRLLRDRVLLSRKGDVTVHDLSVEVLSHLVAITHPPGAQPDLSGIAEPSGGDGDDDLCEVGRDRPEQRLALSGPSGGEEGVLAGHEALAFVVGVCDLAEVLLVEQRGLDRTVFQERLDLRSPQAVTHPKPPVSLGATIGAEVIMPRSPTKTSRLSPKRALVASTISTKLFGSEVLSGKTSIVTGRPSLVATTPYSTRRLARLPSRE
jgi:hypothetical protein